MRSNAIVPTGMPTLARGSHSPGEGKACVMEYVSMIAGEDWSDQPKCVDRALAAACRSINDTVEDDERGFLLRLVPRVMGTSGKKKMIGDKHISLSQHLLQQTANHTMRFMEDERAHSPRVMRDYTNACIQMGKAMAVSGGEKEMEALYCNTLSFYACVWGRSGKGEQFMNWLLDQFEYATTVQVEAEPIRFTTGGLWTTYQSMLSSDGTIHVALYTSNPMKHEPEPVPEMTVPKALTFTVSDLVGVGS